MSPEELRGAAERVLAARADGKAAYVAADPNALLALLASVDRVQELTRENERLTEELRRFGKHAHSCRLHGWLVGVPALRQEFKTAPSCDCGFDAALNPAGSDA